MTWFPKSREEWAQLGQGLVKGYLRLKIAFFLIGVATTLIVQFFSGFWAFRENNEALLRTQWVEVIAAQEEFEKELTKIDKILLGEPSPEAGRDYARAAETYIRKMQAVTRFLPDTSDEIGEYIDAIATLRQYYNDGQEVQPKSEEWMVFYGHFRVDYKRYVMAREKYLSVVSDELGDYVRYISNS